MEVLSIEEERELSILQELQKSRTRWLSQEEFDRIQELAKLKYGSITIDDTLDFALYVCGIFIKNPVQNIKHVEDE